MTDRKPPDTSSEEDFAAMFAASERETGQARRPRFAIGDRVRGKIVSIGQEVTVLELAGGGEGTLETLELRDEDGQLTVKEGDPLEARVDRARREAGVRDAPARPRSGRPSRTSPRRSPPACPSEGLITGVNKGGLEVDVGRRARLLSAVAARAAAGRRSGRLHRPAARRSGSRATKRIGVAPTSCCRGARCSRKRHGGAPSETRGKLVVGAVLPGVVTALKDFGAFVDVGGIEGLLPASEISFDRGVRPADVLTVGQPVTVQVMRVEKRDDPKRPEQVSFSLKALERDPWQDAAAQFPAGTVVRGQVMRTESFGAFVQLTPGVEGLIHISELGAQRPLRHARDAVKPGDPLDVTVLALEPDKRRISLGLASREVSASTTKAAPRPRARRAAAAARAAWELWGTSSRASCRAGAEARRGLRGLQARLQALQHRGVGAHPEDHTALVVAFAQHLAGGEDVAAQLLAIVGDADLAFHELAVEERDQAFAQPGDVRRAAGRHHHRVRPAREQRLRRPLLGRGVAARVDLVEHQEARHVAGADVGEHLGGHRELALEGRAPTRRRPARAAPPPAPRRAWS